MSAYLFIHFTMDGERDEETIWFSVSRDGLHWNDIGTDTPILKSTIGRKGVRDPFIVYDETLNKYFIIATDMNTAGGFNWDTAHLTGSRSIIVWESENLIDFSKPWLAEVGVQNAGCVWAPEAIYSKEKNAWFVFWASCVKEFDDEIPKQRIYGTFTTDFKSFSETFKYIEADKDIIDTDIVYADGYYYRFSKDDTNKCVTIERSQDLLGDFERVRSEQVDALEGVEGPLAYYLEGEKKWCLLLDFYRIKGGYKPYLTSDIANGNFEKLTDSAYNMGIRKKRHGGVISISDEMCDKLISYYGIM